MTLAQQSAILEDSVEIRDEIIAEINEREDIQSFDARSISSNHDPENSNRSRQSIGDQLEP